MKQSEIQVSVPGRICLFGEHQDFLGLSVIAMAIDLRMVFSAKPRRDKTLHISMPDIDEKMVIKPYEEVRYEKKRDYLRSVVNILKRRGIGFGDGYSVEITSKIPINAGVSSSSAMVIGWTKLLLELESSALKDNFLEIAKIGHQAEVLEFKESGGMMDHYTCTLGGLLYIDCAEPITVEPFNMDIAGFVLCNSLEKKDTIDILKKSKEGYRSGEAHLRLEYSDFSLKTTQIEAVVSCIEKLPEREKGMVYANLRNRDICQEAKRAIQKGDFGKIGSLLDAHHKMLRDHLGISTPKIEAMIDAAKKAGAKGCKINGSGGGGTMIAYAPGCEEKVAEEVRKLEADAYIVSKAEGVRAETSVN
jgi:galactokinase